VLAPVTFKTADMASTMEPAETRHEAPADDTRAFETAAYFISLLLHDTLSRTTAMSRCVSEVRETSHSTTVLYFDG